MSASLRSDVLVIGGGVAGAAAAILLARAGCHVVLLEREREAKHKVCGEFLSHETVSHLASLGVDLHALGAEPIAGVRVAGRKRVASAALPFAALSVTRRALDEHLLLLAQSAGANVLRGASVQGLTREGGGWQALTAGGALYTAPAVLLASGKHDLRAHARPAGTQGDLVAFKMYFRLAPGQAAALAGHVELALFPAGYAGLQPVEADAANLCCVVRRETLRRLGGTWASLLAHIRSHCPHLAARLHAATPLLDHALAVAAIPYGFVCANTQPGLWRLGDQAAVIPSFTGDGMAIALHSARRAAQALLAGSSAPAFQRALAAELRPQVRLATMLSRAMVTPAGQHAAQAALRIWPGAMRSIALRTRLRAGDNFLPSMQ